ncbi:MAG: hypothetical protein JGK17_16800 [Microcoleus sp. PH2017_10_PVI_O_A]|uniref:hypothetical protein n=1 Tax=unclassified Microcoleus TaxID=2642155 RepID=UPI001DE1F9E4|nr:MULTISPECIES: hypothetical protein [unclassified Microcoleus]MCC3407220.1 hypothetical protein [Microcoleus sp. PH2017_10_PVI_O_A]MCC3461294.1 hypothetical protein [Microcoleus sp. PH2017_11_PCY_U_A]MCC3479750.1 hypothetical protein [Microcoleus sp. PH2017_12_PCY_D_A]MCC3529918.1 hypothetical protein [Microcoleus sp. PH2017_21_RUC_O_A]MCC3542212.1 hypothetical protein [Microcoleus sp. PH2017_22_RUC_O_B]
MLPINRIPAFGRVEMPNLAKYRSHLTAISCDRMCPQDTLGGGVFRVLFQNTSPRLLRFNQFHQPLTIRVHPRSSAVKKIFPEH